QHLTRHKLLRASEDELELAAAERGAHTGLRGAPRRREGWAYPIRVRAPPLKGDASRPCKTYSSQQSRQHDPRSIPAHDEEGQRQFDDEQDDVCLPELTGADGEQ